jgi:hypothetical protein
MYDEVALLLYSLIKFYQPELIIQIGHLWGKSAMIALEGINDGFLGEGSGIDDQEQNADKAFSNFVLEHRPVPNAKAKLLSIDPAPLAVPNSAAGIDYLRQLHLNFEFHQMLSSKFFEENSETIKSNHANQRIMGIVDGDHTWEGCLEDLENLAALNAQMILVDDTIWLPYLGRVARAFARRHGYDVLNLSLHNGVTLLYKDNFKVNRQRRYAVRDALYTIGGFKFAKAMFKLIWG